MAALKTQTPNLGGSGTGFAQAAASDLQTLASGVIGGVWYFGHGLPSDALGKNGDLYLNTDTADVYAKENGTWL